MRKNILFILIIILFLSNIYLGSDNESKFAQYDDNIYIDKALEWEDASIIHYYLDLIPEWILNEYDGKIFITSSLNDMIDYPEKIAGAFEINSHDIYIDASNMDCLLHEMGHFYYHNILDDKNGLSDLLRNEGMDFHHHYRLNENEFFAECFRKALLQDEDFIINSPMSYAYILRALEGPYFASN